MAISAATLAARFCIEMHDALTVHQMALVIERNKTSYYANTGDFFNTRACASFEVCDAAEVMLDAMLLMGVKRDPEDVNQAAWIEEAWTIARAVDFDAERAAKAGYYKEYEPKPKPLDPLDKAHLLACQLCDALVFSNREAPALLHLHLLPLIAKAGELKHALDVLQDAIKQDA